MKGPIIAFILVGLISLGLGIGYGWKTGLIPTDRFPDEELKAGLPPTSTQKALGNLLAKTTTEIEQVDTATLNWACLGGLPGTESIDLDAARARIKQLAETVKASTKSTLELRRKTDKHVQDTPQLRADVMYYVLQQDYQKSHFADQFYPDHSSHTDWGKVRPEDLFFQSVPNNRDPAVGNPILIVAVAQQLKYPVKLASAPGHFYAIWNDGKTKFILQDPTGRVPPLTVDQFKKYFSATAADISKGHLYHEYTQAETFAAFLQARGNALESLGTLEQATLAYAAAHRFASETSLFSEYLASAIDTRMRDHNLDWKLMDETNADRFNLTQPGSPKELKR